MIHISFSIKIKIKLFFLFFNCEISVDILRVFTIGQIYFSVQFVVTVAMLFSNNLLIRVPGNEYIRTSSDFYRRSRKMKFYDSFQNLIAIVKLDVSLSAVEPV